VGVKLKQEEKDILGGKRGELVSKLMKLLVKTGEARGAKEMVDVYSVHTSTMILEYTGYPGIELMEEVRDAGTRFKAHTTVDPISIDREDWESLGISKEYADLQMRSVKAFAECGGVGHYTCTPWVWGNVPRCGQHVAWVETSAVVYANSILGARTNRHVDPSALAVAICGKTPKYGFHLDENRRGEVLVEVKTDLVQTSDYAALGAYVASKFGPKVYVFDGMLKDLTMESLIRMSSAMSTWGNVAMYHIVGVTPEARTREEAFAGNKVQEHLVVRRKELDTIYDQFPRVNKGKKLVLIGCPFCTFEDLKKIAGLIEGRRVCDDVGFWVLTSRANKNIAKETGWVSAIEKAGGRVIADMCWLCSPPLDVFKFESVATDSAKGAFLARAKNRVATLVSTDECIDIAVKGL
jgi:predicted aconitase